MEIESSTFFPHYGGLEGEVTRLFDNGEVAIRINRDLLPEGISKMHKHIEGRIKTKFMDSLSEEGRKRLTPEEKAINLSFQVLVKVDDVEGAKSTPKAAAKPADNPEHRKTAEELDAAEAEYLENRKK